MEGQKALITDFIYGNQAALYRLAFAYTRSREAALDIVQDTVVETLPEQQAEDADIGERLDVYRAVERLDPKLRTVVMLRFYEDMKLEDIAHITGANLSTVKSRLYTALGRLREELGCDIG